ncbi:Uncharacterised protein [Mycobacterium tuberculosis]|nr:Uncharacterised protein [Mycobacterium tuberculosis]
MPRLVRELDHALEALGLASVDALVGTVKHVDEAINLAEYA